MIVLIEMFFLFHWIYFNCVKNKRRAMNLLVAGATDEFEWGLLLCWTWERFDLLTILLNISFLFWVFSTFSSRESIFRTKSPGIAILDIFMLKHTYIQSYKHSYAQSSTLRRHIAYVCTFIVYSTYYPTRIYIICFFESQSHVPISPFSLSKSRSKNLIMMDA